MSAEADRQDTAIDRLLAVMARLRDPRTGCPWDLEQDFSTIAPYTIEEAYEVADAIQRGALDELRDELGDLLFQVVFHARMAEEQGLFDFNAVAAAAVDKMERRHPHVFGDVSIDDAGQQTRAWEEHKAEERRHKGQDSLLDGIGRGLPELTRAFKLQKRAARVGFDWPDAGAVLAKLREELAELEVEIETGDCDAAEDELGDLLFVCTNLARKLDLDPGHALRRSNAKFERRFGAMEVLADGRLAEMDIDQLEALWQQVKRRSPADGGDTA